MRVANYYRVSTTLQEKKFSLAAQQTELRSYAKNQNWKIIDEFTDVETGGKLNKAGLNALLDLAENGKIEVVLCMDQDRLSRLDTVSWEYLKSVLRENNVKIAEPTGTLTDLSNEDDEFMSDLRNLMAQREKKSVVRRMMYGKRQRLREGKGWGVAPFEYEYDKNDGKYYIKKGWEWVIPFIDNLYINEKLGMKSISNALNDVSKTPTNNRWNEHLVWRRLVSKAFHGIQEKEFSTGETIATPGIFEPVRTEEVYNKIQSIRKKRGKQYSVNTRTSQFNINLLKYVPITCGRCGRVISVQQQGSIDKPRFYASHGRVEVASGDRCDINVNAVRYEYNMIKAIKEILTGKELSSRYINFETNDEELSVLQKTISKNKEVLNTLNAAKDRLLDLYLSGNSLEKDDYLKKDKELTKKIETTKKQIEQSERKTAAINKDAWNYEILCDYIESVGSFGVELSRHEQAHTIGDLFSSAVLTETELVLTTEIYNNIPVDVKIPVEENAWTVNGWIRRDKREGTVNFRYK